MKKMKNLIFIFADQWRASALGFLGEEDVITPNFDKFAKENIYATNAVSSCPLCSPYRASLLTGKQPLNTGVFTNCKPELPIHLKDDEICISDVLKDQGYATCYLGKWHLDVPEERSKAFPECGATGWDAYTPPGKSRHGFDYWLSYGACNNHMHEHYWRNSPEKVYADEGKWSPEYEVDIAMDYINNHSKDKPFAMFISWNPPHTPYNQVPDKYLDMYKNRDIKLKDNMTLKGFSSHTPEFDKPWKSEEENLLNIKQYYAAITGLDDQFGRLINYLKENNLFDETYIVVTADHGDMLGAHGMCGKHVWFEESVGVPFMISGPKLSSGKYEAVISTPDIMPTILDLLDIKIPNTVEGKDLSASLIKLEEDDNVGYLGCSPGLGVYTEAFSKTSLVQQDFGWRAIRTQDQCFVMEIGYYPNEHPEVKYYYYDLKTNPLQQGDCQVFNLMDQPKVKGLHDKLVKFLEDQHDGFVKYI